MTLLTDSPAWPQGPGNRRVGHAAVTVPLLEAQAAEDGGVAPLDQIVDSLSGIARGLFTSLPRVVLAAAVLAVFVLVGRELRNRVEPRLAALRTPSFGRVFATLAYVGVVVAGLVVALPIAVPSLSVAGMLAGLGLLGVAASFAFQDILSNLLAGILLILRQPFTAGDQIEVNDLRGTVEVITIRETRLRTFTGRLLVVPNTDVYMNAIEVQTAYEAIRTDLEVGVSYDSDLTHAREVALAAVRQVDGVLEEPAPQAFFTEFGGSSMNFDLRYWTSPQQADVRAVQDRVVQAVFDAYNHVGINIPFGIITLDTLPSFDRALRGVGARGDGQPAARRTDTAP